MLKFLDSIPYPILIFGALVMLILPVKPMPHAVEKIQMLLNGTLRRPIDIFDLLFHLFPLILLLMKIFWDKPWK